MKRIPFIVTSLVVLSFTFAYNPGTSNAANMRRSPSTQGSIQAAPRRTPPAMIQPASVRSVKPASPSLITGGPPINISLSGSDLQLLDKVSVLPGSGVFAALENVMQGQIMSKRSVTLTPKADASGGSYKLMLYQSNGTRLVKTLNFTVSARQKSTQHTVMTSNVMKTRQEAQRPAENNIRRSSSASSRTTAPLRLSGPLSSQIRQVSKTPAASVKNIPKRSTQLESAQGEQGKLGQLPGTGAGLQDPTKTLDKLRGGTQGSVSGPGSFSGLSELKQRSGGLSLDRGTPGNPAKDSLPASPGLGDSRAMAPTQQVKGSGGTPDKPDAGSPATGGNEGTSSSGTAGESGTGSSGDTSGGTAGDSSGGTSGGTSGETSGSSDGGSVTVTSSDLDTEDSDGNSETSSTVTTEGSDGSSSTHTVTQISGSDGSVTEEQSVWATDKDGKTTWEYSCTGPLCNPDPEEADCVSQQCTEFINWVQASGFVRDRTLLNPRDTLINTGRDGSGTSSVTGNRPQAIDSKTVMDTKTSPYILNDSSDEQGIDTPFGGEPKTTGDLIDTLPDPGQSGEGKKRVLPPGTGPDSPGGGG